MFNLGTLLQVSALTMGVASATPISNAKETNVLTTKNENIVTNYDLTLSQTTTNQTQLDSNDDLPSNIYDSYASNMPEIRDYTTNYQGNNSYLNVIASKYRTTTFRSDYTEDLDSMPNYYYVSYNNRTVQQNNNEYNRYSTTDMYVFQIDSYNFNLNNTFIIDIDIQYSNLEYTTETPTGQPIIASEIYLYKEIYITYQNNWALYLQRQPTHYGVKYIQDEVENVNNNFYYSKTNELISKNTIIQNNYKNSSQINLQPNNTTYVIIKYTPMIYGTIGLTTTEYNPNYENIPLNSDHLIGTGANIKITGTNIIPDGSYEVIDLPGLMWEILTMPFAFISQAFNLTLFPGTPYQLNISNLFLSLIAIFTFIWLITLFIKMKG